MTISNTLILGDCIEAMAKLEPESIDFVLTDPPYLIDYRGRDGRSVTNDDNTRWLRPAFAKIHRALKPASFCVSFYAWNRVQLFMTAWRDAGFRAVGHIVFRKRSHPPLAFFVTSTKWPICSQRATLRRPRGPSPM